MAILFSLHSLLFLFLSISFCFYFYFLEKHSKIGFKFYLLVKTIMGFLKNRYRLLDWITEILANCPNKTVLLPRVVITANPSYVEHMFKSNFDNYPKGNPFTSRFVDLFGQGLFVSDGESWRVLRKTLSHKFDIKLLRNFVVENAFIEIEKNLVQVLEGESESARIFDLQDVLERFAFDNACEFAFGVDLGFLERRKLMKAYEDAAKLCDLRPMYPSTLWKLKKFFNVGSERRLRESIATIDRFVENIVRSRISEAKAEKGGSDVLSQLIENDNDIGNSKEFIRDMILGFILAAVDTTSSALTWFFWLISSRPEIQESILKEIKSIRTRHSKNMGDSYSLDELRDMHYLHAAISESMRLYPPVPINSRTCLKDDVLPDGTVIRKDWLVVFHTYAMGRMETIWGRNCHEFRPERWLEDGAYRSASPYRYPIFHAGPRMCLGKDVAYIQMKSITAAVIERFEIKLQKKETCPDNVASFTLRMKDGLPITVGVRKR